MIDFSIEKIVYISKEMLESDLEICIISVNKLKKKIWEYFKQVKIL